MAASVVRKHFEFVFGIEDAQFNNTGRYYLRITVKSAFSNDYQNLWVKSNFPGEEFEPGHEIDTDIVVQEEKRKFVFFKKNQISFFLPKGFCKNDPHHDVYLSVEAFRVNSDSTTSPGRKVGEAKFAIFPRTDAPRADFQALPGQNLYKQTSIMTLLRTQSSENLKVHCGRLKFTAAFREMLNPPVQTPRQPSIPPPPPPQKAPVSPKPKTPPPQKQPSPKPKPVSPEPDTARDTADWSLNFPRSPTPGGHDDRGTTADSPHLQTNRDPSTTRNIHGQDIHVARPGHEDIVVILHGAANLPSLALEGKSPMPFCALKTKTEDDNAQPAQGVSRAAIQRTHSPSYEEGFVVEYNEEKCLDEVLVLRFADKPSKEILVTYNLPVSFLWPFHQYHLEMVMPSRTSPSGVRVFATVMRRQSTLPRDLSSPNYLALEVLVQGVEEMLQNPVGRLIAVARIVPDYYSYKWADQRDDAFLNGNLVKNGGVSMTTVSFPSPHPSLFAIPDSNSQGYPQVTLPGGPQEQPVWDHSFLFTHQRDKATLFTPAAALVIEYFQASSAMSDMSWRLRNPIGFSTLLLDQSVYRQLAADGAKMGLRVTKLPVQGTQLKTVRDRMPTVGMILKLIRSERPSTLVAPSDPDSLPLLQYLPQDEGETQRMYRSTVSLQQSIHPSIRSLPNWNYSDLNLHSPAPEEDGEVDFPNTTRSGYWVKQRILKNTDLPVQDGESLPSHDAMENILPEYQYIFVDPDAKRNTPSQAHTFKKLPDDAEKGSLHLLDYQMQELEKYRTAVQKMGQDILTLRQEIRDLGSTNSQLRRDLSKYNDSTKLLLDSQELDGLTKPELAARYVALKQKLTSQTSELRDYKDRVQKLQNHMIKQNDQEKNMLRMSHAHMSQNELLQKLQDRAQKVKRLEDACKKQEKVIEKMEKLLGKRPVAKSGPPDGRPDPTTEAVMEENKRLRSEMDQLREQNRLLNAQKGFQAADDEEKLHLYERLERDEGRILSLEKKLSENARIWGREKSELLTKLQEAELGLRRVNPTNKPLQPLAYSYDTSLRDEPRRYSKAPNRPKYAVGSHKHGHHHHIH